MAVDDDFHGKGLGTILLERLAMLASTPRLHQTVGGDTC